MSLFHLRGELNEAASYEAASGVRWSLLKNMRTSALHFDAATRAPERRTDALLLGGAVHCAIFEPEHFDKRFVIYAEPKSVGKGARKRWEEFKKSNAHRQILDEKQNNEVWAISGAVMKHSEAKKLLESGRAEIPLQWQHASGTWCKSKLDWLTGNAAIVELKTACSIGHSFKGQAWQLGYFHQAAFYRRAAEFGTGRSAETIPHYMIAVENDAPYDVGVFQTDEESLRLADIEVDELIAKYLECRKSDKWPGQYPELSLLRAPEWVFALDGEAEIEVSP